MENAGKPVMNNLILIDNFFRDVESVNEWPSRVVELIDKRPVQDSSICQLET